jgi:hypothetical protein
VPRSHLTSGKRERMQLSIRLGCQVDTGLKSGQGDNALHISGNLRLRLE